MGPSMGWLGWVEFSGCSVGCVGLGPENKRDEVKASALEYKSKTTCSIENLMKTIKHNSITITASAESLNDGEVRLLKHCDLQYASQDQRSLVTVVYNFSVYRSQSRFPDFAGAGPRANIEDGSSLIIHWISGLHKSTNWTNHIILAGPPTRGGPGPWPTGLPKSGPAQVVPRSRPRTADRVVEDPRGQ